MKTIREAFEEWFSEAGAHPNAIKCRTAGGEYLLSQAATAWSVWQAAHSSRDEQVRILREALDQIKGMAEVRGRWLDSEGTAVEECAHDEGLAPEGAIWTPYDLEEQNAALEAVAERALAALEATKEGA